MNDPNVVEMVKLAENSRGIVLGCFCRVDRNAINFDGFVFHSLPFMRKLKIGQTHRAMCHATFPLFY